MAQEEPIAAGDDFILSGGEQNISQDQQAGGDAFKESGKEGSPDIDGEQAPHKTFSAYDLRKRPDNASYESARLKEERAHDQEGRAGAPRHLLSSS